MFDGFTRERVDTGEVEINLVRGGSGPPVLLLHGYPQTHAMWHLVAPGLAERFTVVAPDLRGYGDSSKPPGDSVHAVYSKRAMAVDQVALMETLGFERFAVAGHDRGGRVAHRLALDHPDRLTSLAILDIVPTRAVFESTDSRIATSTYHWFFLSQPFDLPERLVGHGAELLSPLVPALVEPWARRLLRPRGPRGVRTLLRRPGLHPCHVRGLPCWRVDRP